MVTRSTRKQKEAEKTNLPVYNAVPSLTELHNLVTARAHEIYLARNGAPGDDLDDWLSAEREVIGSIAVHKPSANNAIPISSGAAELKRKAVARTKSSAVGSTEKKRPGATSTRKRKEKSQ